MCYITQKLTSHWLIPFPPQNVNKKWITNIAAKLFFDRFKMYNHQYLDPDKDHRSLQIKVQFDIRFFFARRGSENMEIMKDVFKICFDIKLGSWKNKRRINKKSQETWKNYYWIHARKQSDELSCMLLLHIPWTPQTNQ